MAKEKDILRMHFEGFSQRDICAALKCGHSKVNGVIAAARKAEKSPLPNLCKNSLPNCGKNSLPPTKWQQRAHCLHRTVGRRLRPIRRPCQRLR
jgi:hypothetical protein